MAEAASVEAEVVVAVVVVDLLSGTALAARELVGVKLLLLLVVVVVIVQRQRCQLNRLRGRR